MSSKGGILWRYPLLFSLSFRDWVPFSWRCISICFCVYCKEVGVVQFHHNIDHEWQVYQQANLLLSYVCDIVLTRALVLIALKIWLTDKQTAAVFRSCSMSSAMPVAIIIIESGAIYPLSLLTVLILFYN